MTGLYPSLAVTIATMLLLVAILGLYEGDVEPTCPVCGSRSREHHDDCPWRRRQRDLRS